MGDLVSRSRAKVALVVAHPGHELRLATWIARHQPLVFIVAKGARAGRSEARIQASRVLAEELGATAVEPLGMAFDSEIYDWIMRGEVQVFSNMVDDLRIAFIERGVERVVTDAWQNYNPVHDLTHALARTAAAEASSAVGRWIEVLAYPVVMGSLANAPNGAEHSRIDLSPQEVTAKMTLVDRYPDIVEDIRIMKDAVGGSAFDTETLHYPPPLGTLIALCEDSPWYERYGEEKVLAGVYSNVLRWSHLAPIVAMLSNRLTAAEELWRNLDARRSVASPVNQA